jgi:hypothetical protein
VWARWKHNDVVKAYRWRLRSYRDEGKSYAEAERLALANVTASEGEIALFEHVEVMPPVVRSIAQTFDLGSHTLEVLEDQSVLVMDHAAEKEAVQLDAEESYRLLVALQSVFAQTSSMC